MTLLLDLRHTLRSIRRNPVLFVSASLAIALGIGASTAVFSWMDNLVLHPFPGLRQPDRIVGIETRFPVGDGGPVSFPAYRSWREQSHSYAGMAAWSITRVSVRRAGSNASTSQVAMLTTGDYARVLGGTTYLGRTILPDDERQRRPVAVLGFEGWRREFGGDSSVIGASIFLNGQAYTIAGVMAPRFVGTYLGVVPDLFVPLTTQPLLTGVDQLDDARSRSYQVVARLADGVALESARRETDAVARRLSAGWGDTPVLGAEVIDAREQYLGGIVQPLLGATLVVTALLLLVGCANVSGLLLVRSTARTGELSLRVALGASAAQLGRLVLLETLAVAVTGGTLGIGVAYLARGVLQAFIPTASYPITLPIDISARVLGFAACAVLAALLACSVVPVLRARRIPAAGALRAGSSDTGRFTSRLRLGIVAGQLAFSLICLVTAGLFMLGLRAAGAVHLGFTAPERVLLVNTDLAPAMVRDSARAAITREVLRRVRAIPGVQHASVATFVPLGFGGRRVATARVDGYAPARDEDMSVIRSFVGDDYARAMGIAVLEGRDIAGTDRAGTSPVALVNATFARRFVPNGPVIGRRVDVGPGWASIVGVLADGKYATLAERPQPVVYLAMDQSPQSAFTVHVRTPADPLALVEAVRAAVRATHVDLPVLQARTLTEQVAATTFVPRVGASVLGALGGAAVLLGLIGLHGAIAFSVLLRTRELGVRRALGASERDLLGVAIRPAVAVVCLGAITGIGVGVLMGQLLRVRLPQLASVSVFDPLLLGGSLAVLVIAACVASLLPALRAARVDPCIALRDAGA